MPKDYKTKLRELNTRLQKSLALLEGAFEERVLQHPGYTDKVVKPIKANVKKARLALEQDDLKGIVDNLSNILVAMVEANKRLGATPGGVARGKQKTEKAAPRKADVLAEWRKRKQMPDRQAALWISKELNIPYDTVRDIIKKEKKRVGD